MMNNNFNNGAANNNSNNNGGFIMDFKLKAFDTPINVTKIANIHYFEFTKDYQTSFDGKTYMKDPILDSKIAKNGFLTEVFIRLPLPPASTIAQFFILFLPIVLRVSNSEPHSDPIRGVYHSYIHNKLPHRSLLRCQYNILVMDSRILLLVLRRLFSSLL